ncbi:MAG TPA: hypothetical protein VFQ13_26195, partial [Anaerolineales bacterium]|nr:hypothetical protein [Anaerolineales bacterium]
SGQTPPEHVRLRLEQHLQQTLQLVSGMEDAKLAQELLQLRDQLQKHEHDMQDLQARATQAEQPVLEHTRTMLQTQLHLVDDGLANHEVFRNTVNNGFHYGQTQTPPVPSPSPTSLQEPTGEATPEPGNNGNGNGLGPNNNPGGPNSGMTPTPGNGNNGTTPGNNGGGNDKDKGPKDKDPNPNRPNTKTPKK